MLCNLYRYLTFCVNILSFLFLLLSFFHVNYLIQIQTLIIWKLQLNNEEAMHPIDHGLD